MDWGAYWLGFASPFVVALLIVVAVLLFRPSDVIAHASGCDLCGQLGWRERLPRGRHRTVLGQWVADEVVHEFRARRMARPKLWQAKLAPHPTWVRHESSWRRYGLGATTA